MIASMLSDVVGAADVGSADCEEGRILLGWTVGSSIGLAVGSTDGFALGDDDGFEVENGTTKAPHVHQSEPVRFIISNQSSLCWS